MILTRSLKVAENGLQTRLARYSAHSRKGPGGTSEENIIAGQDIGNENQNNSRLQEFVCDR